MYALIAILAVLFFVAFPLATTLYFVHLSRIDGHWRELQSRPGGAWAMVGRMLVHNTLSLCRIAGLYPLGWLPSWAFPAPGRGGGGPRVLMIHGLFHNASAWYVFKRRLARAGIGRMGTVTYDSFFRDFDRAVNRAARAALAMAGQGGEIVLVGHSLGGLITRALMAHPEVGPRVACAVTLGAPHHGSMLGSLSVSPMVRSLKYRGDLAQRMEALVPVREQPRLSLFTPVDNMVVPAGALRISAPGWEERETGPLSHVGMAFDATVADEVIAFIKRHAQGAEGDGVGPGG